MSWFFLKKNLKIKLLNCANKSEIVFSVKKKIKKKKHFFFNVLLFNYWCRPERKWRA